LCVCGITRTSFIFFSAAAWKVKIFSAEGALTFFIGVTGCKINKIFGSTFATNSTAEKNSSAVVESVTTILTYKSFLWVRRKNFSCKAKRFFPTLGNFISMLTISTAPEIFLNSSGKVPFVSKKIFTPKFFTAPATSRTNCQCKSGSPPVKLTACVGTSPLKFFMTSTTCAASRGFFSSRKIVEPAAVSILQNSARKKFVSQYAQFKLQSARRTKICRQPRYFPSPCTDEKISMTFALLIIRYA